MTRASSLPAASALPITRRTEKIRKEILEEIKKEKQLKDEEK
jgi:hypothetical protein